MRALFAQGRPPALVGARSTRHALWGCLEAVCLLNMGFGAYSVCVVGGVFAIVMKILIHALGRATQAAQLEVSRDARWSQRRAYWVYDSNYTHRIIAKMSLYGTPVFYLASLRLGAYDVWPFYEDIRAASRQC